MADSGIQFKSVAPQFLVRDVAQTAEYYRDVLGFEITAYFLDPPVHGIVRRGGCEVFFGKANTETTISNRRLKAIGIDAYFWVKGLDALAQEIIARSGGKIIEGPVERIYQVRELEVEDCNGFVLVFAEAAT
jgi:hypothetical protein